jgi:hypothetical protein
VYRIKSFCPFDQGDHSPDSRGRSTTFNFGSWGRASRKGEKSVDGQELLSVGLTKGTPGIEKDGKRIN